MNVPILSQHNPVWGAQRLGTRDTTSIASHGCACTCVTMANLAFDPGSKLMPNNVDDILTNGGGYVKIGPRGGIVARSPQADCNALDWSRIQQLFPNCAHVAVGWYTSGPADLPRIKQHLDGGGLVILQVWWKGNTNLMHFVLAVGYNGDDIIVNDPETGRQVGFSARLFGTGNSATDIQVAHFMADAIPNTPPASVPAPAPATPSPGKGSGNNGDTPMTDEQEQEAYRIVLGREREGGPTGRSGYQFMKDAVAEINAHRGHDFEVAKELEAARDIAGKQAQTITTLNEELGRHVPEYERTFIDGPEAEVITIEEIILVDFADQQPPVTLPVNTIVEVRGKFSIGASVYLRTKKSTENGYFYGVPQPLAADYVAPAGEAAPELDLRPAAPQLNASQQLFAIFAEGFKGWKRARIKLFGGK